MGVENNGKYSNMVTVISMLVSIIIFIKLILSKGIKQVHYLTSTLYVVPIVVSIISFVVIGRLNRSLREMKVMPN